MKNNSKTGKLENIRKFLKAANLSHWIRTDVEYAFDNIHKLAEIDSDFARKRLVNILFGKPYSPEFASKAILGSDSNKFVPFLKRKLEKTKYFDRRIPKDIDRAGGIVTAIHTLGEIGTKEALMALIDLTKITHPYVSNKIKKAGQNALMKLNENRNQKDPLSPIELAIRHIDPFEHPKSFMKFHEQLKKGKNKSESHLKLTAKQLMAMETRLK